MKTFGLRIVLLAVVLSSLSAFADPLAPPVALGQSALLEPSEVRVPADPDAPTLSAFAGLGYLASPGTNGAVFNSGVRLGLLRYLALSADLGFGMVGAFGAVPDPSHRVEDRWWLIPAVALTVPYRSLRIDLGAGAGFATASGFSSWSAFGAAPFSPVWAFQLAPAVRGHALVAVPMGSRVEFLGRVEVGSLLLGGNTVGLRNGNPDPTSSDTLWVSLSAGLRYDFF